jgi:transposase-like protein
MAKWDRHTKEFKVRAVKRMQECSNVRALARELEVSRQVLYQWKYEVEGERPKKQPKPAGSESPACIELKKQIIDLKVALADKTLEASFFRGALQRVEDLRRKTGSNGDPASTTTPRR